MFTYLNNGPYEELQYRLHLKIYKYYFGGGSGAYSLNTDEYRMYQVYVSFLDVLGYTKFKMCWYTCHLRSTTFMD